MVYKRKYCYALLCIVMLCCSFTIFGAEPSIIKVGLESVYKNAAAINLSSDTPMTFGYYDNNGFRMIGVLESNQITIKKATAQYQENGSIYANYDAALEGAYTLGGVPAYLDQNLYSVYQESDSGNVLASSDRYMVTDTATGKVLLVFNKTEQPLVFQGYDQTTGLNLTKVGNTKKYRGAIGLGGTTGITPFNILDIESYLYGVVPGEMSASWPAEALKAQAVAARSIAIYQYNRYTASGYNVVDTTSTQVYGGYTKEDSRTNAAVDATRGETIKYNGKTAEALYFSTSGGMTESAVNVWGSHIPYLVGVSDSYETEPAQAAWSRNITLADLDACLANQGVNIGSAQGIQIVSRTPSGRVQEMKVLGTVGSYSLTLEKVRTFFSSAAGGSLKSRLFNLGDNSTGGNTVATSKVVIQSETGLIEVASNGLMATDGNNLTILDGQVAVQTANGQTTLTVGDNDQGSSTGGETVWGNFTIYGEGFGHGVGMSQSGAKGMAKAGYNYKQILQHYYTGVTVE